MADGQRDRTISGMARTDDPFNGPWGPILGRLERLDTQISELEAKGPDAKLAWPSLIFTVGMLRSLLEDVVLDMRERFPNGPL